ncbi:MAG TPA: sulfatase-like hydrolase/transferase [Tepidisphaeraceae bacterium]|jgi:uncharacterized sulfatase|nr:sulfatase-like hydrolase/transferase [Tepidisphaeraceae bacterium]
MKRPPNILLITTDQQHYSLLGSVNPAIRTPHLDQLAAGGVRFDRAYCPNPLCTPTRGTLLTGQYPSRHGGWTIGAKVREAHEGGGPFIGDLLRPAGYESHLVGKAHFQPLADVPGQRSIECQPLLRDLNFWRQFGGAGSQPWYGFDRVDTARMHTAESHVGQHYAIWLEEKGLKDWTVYFNTPSPLGTDSGDRYGEGPMAWRIPEELHYNNWIVERTLDHVGRCVERDRPFFTWASFFDPHPPYVTPEPWFSMYDPADVPLPPEVSSEAMADMPPPHRAALAKSGDFTEWLETAHANHGYSSHRRGLDRTWLARATAAYYGMMTFTDAAIGKILDGLTRLGAQDDTLVVFTSDHGHYLGHHGLVAKGAFHYEDGIRVPMIARWPGQLPAGEVRRDLQSLVDFVPTFLEAAGLAACDDVQGVGRLTNWKDGAAGRQVCRVENRHQPTSVHLHTYITSDAKLTLYRGRDYGELFDLRSDPGETRNLWSVPSASALKCQMLEAAMQEQIQSEPLLTRRVAGA